MCSPLLSVSFGLVFFAIDFFNLTPPVVSFLGSSLVAEERSLVEEDGSVEFNFAALFDSAKLISELEAIEAMFIGKQTSRFLTRWKPYLCG